VSGKFAVVLVNVVTGTEEEDDDEGETKGEAGYNLQAAVNGRFGDPR
jgi:hypothetical protein